ncbi:MAG: hypothetical protein FWH54_03610 [Methanobrevibacter sp.]|nr:hypothetical protein [Methanobrevibacter sp.]
MEIKQISVFIENRKGRLKKALDTLSKAEINIRALSLAERAKYGILRLIVSDNEKAKSVLEENKFIVKENDVIVVEVPDKPNGLNSILEVLTDADINVEYLYAFVGKKTDEAIVVMRLENIEDGIKVLKSQNANLLTKEYIENL